MNNQKVIDLKISGVKKSEYILGKANAVNQAEMEVAKAERLLVKVQRESDGIRSDALIEEERLIQERVFEAKNKAELTKHQFLEAQAYGMIFIDNVAAANEELVIKRDVNSSNPESLLEAKKTSQDLHEILDEIILAKSSAIDFSENDSSKTVSKDEEMLDEHLSRDISFLKSNFAAEKLQKIAETRLIRLDLSIIKSELKRLKDKDPKTLTEDERVQIRVMENDVSRFQEEIKKHEQASNQLNSLIRSLE